MAHAVKLSDWARPGTLRRFRREEHEALAQYAEERSAMLRHPERRKRNSYGVGTPAFERAMREALDARDEWLRAWGKVQRCLMAQAKVKAGEIPAPV